MIMQAVEHGMEVEDVVKEVFRSIEEQTFYILTHAPFDKLIKQRMENVLNRTSPQSTW